MKYIGKLYGFFGGKYIPLTQTTEDMDKIETERDEYKRKFDALVDAVNDPAGRITTLEKQRDGLLADKKKLYGWVDDANFKKNEYFARAEKVEKQRDELLAAIKELYHCHVVTLENARDQILSHGGKCDPVDVMEDKSPELTKIRVLITHVEAAR